jgi:hypothetical protein
VSPPRLPHRHPDRPDTTSKPTHAHSPPHRRNPRITTLASAQGTPSFFPRRDCPASLHHAPAALPSHPALRTLCAGCGPPAA